MDKILTDKDFTEYMRIFISENHRVNLISPKEEKFLYEKHIYDSLGIKLFFEKYNIINGNILDIGCGGGFPCVPIALAYPQFNVTGIDSIRKKINAVNNIKEALKIQNLTVICERAENVKNIKFDIITSRAVANLSKISEYALPLLNDKGYFVAYKSKKALDEIDEAQPVFKKYNAKVVDIIKYTLPLNEFYDRNLVIIQK